MPRRTRIHPQERGRIYRRPASADGFWLRNHTPVYANDRDHLKW